MCVTHESCARSRDCLYLVACRACMIERVNKSGFVSTRVANDKFKNKAQQGRVLTAYLSLLSTWPDYDILDFLVFFALYGNIYE